MQAQDQFVWSWKAHPWEEATFRGAVMRLQEAHWSVQHLAHSNTMSTDAGDLASMAKTHLHAGKRMVRGTRVSRLLATSKALSPSGMAPTAYGQLVWEASFSTD